MAFLSRQRKIILVGTTTLRCLESFYQRSESFGGSESLFSLSDNWLDTNLFIYPKNKQDKHKPWACDALITNFHQPYSSLFMLVCSLSIHRDALGNIA